MLIKAAFDPVYEKITQLQGFNNAWMYIRVGLWFTINAYTGFCRCRIAETQEYDEYDELEMKTL